MEHFSNVLLDHYFVRTLLLIEINFWVFHWHDSCLFLFKSLTITLIIRLPTSTLLLSWRVWLFMLSVSLLIFNQRAIFHCSRVSLLFHSCLLIFLLGSIIWIFLAVFLFILVDYWKLAFVLSVIRRLVALSIFWGLLLIFTVIAVEKAAALWIFILLGSYFIKLFFVSGI